MVNFDYFKRKISFIFDFIFLRCCLLCGDILCDERDNHCLCENDFFCKKCKSEILPIDQFNCCHKCGYPFEPLRLYKKNVINSKNVLGKKKVFCQSCRSMHFIFDSAHSCFQYHSKIKKLLMNFKFYFQTEAIDFIGTSMVDVYKNMKKADIICCVPIDRKTLFLKGYNHAALIAGGFLKFAKRINDNVIFLPDLLLKQGKTKQSKNMSQQERLRKKHNFFVNKKYLTPRWIKFFNCKTVLIVDDIMTTGSTLNAAAFTLKQSFVNIDIECLTFARTMLY